MKHGIGKMTYEKAGEYNGFWENGRRHGEGVFKTSKGLSLSGEFKKGKPWDVKISFKKVKFDLTIKSGKVKFGN